ncbi:MAG: twin-arginine translocase TatA/TatE family subunit [Chlorobi bacterium]|nr:twin-arginine translocase TatA/TatE family subunit [Chlorobiota bacterium]
MNLLFFDLGSGEIMLIIIVIFIVFGPSKIPEMARGLGKFINEIKRASEDIKTEINREADRLEREKKLEEYKARIEKDLGTGNNEEKTETEAETKSTGKKETAAEKKSPESSEKETGDQVK